MIYQGKSEVFAKATRFTLDPNIIDTAANILTAVQGAIATSGSAPDKVWRLNASEIASYDSVSPFIDIEFPMIVPVKPTAGDVRSWGLQTPVLDNRGRVEFNVTDDVFSALVYNETGTQLTMYGPTGLTLSSGAVTWDDTNWTNKLVRYRIIHKGFDITFLINETVVAQTRRSQAIPQLAHHMHIRNDNADNMDLSAIIVRNSFNL
ncbi:MAG: hypothetical protein ABII13_05630 [Patescibacteria group bacterium]